MILIQTEYSENYLLLHSNIKVSTKVSLEEKDYLIVNIINFIKIGIVNIKYLLYLIQ